MTHILDPLAIKRIERKYRITFDDFMRDEAFMQNGHVRIEDRFGKTHWETVEILKFPDDLINQETEKGFFDE